jgi:phage-related protein (TIGR01555 family)
MITPVNTKRTINLDKQQGNKGAFIDSFVNLVANLGTSKDKRVYGSFELRDLGIDQLEAMYSDDWLSGKVVDVPVDDSTRKWRKLLAPSIDEKLKTVTDLENELQVKQKVNEAQKWADLYGGAIIVMVMQDDIDVSEPLDFEKVKEGDLSKLVVFDSTEISPMDINTNDITEENFRLPNSYSISGGELIHHTRVLRFEGYKLPWRLKSNNNYWGQSRLQRFYDALRNSRSVIDSVASLMYEAKNDVVSVPQLYQELSSPNGVAKILERFRLGDMLKSNSNMLILDDKEKFQRIHTTFTGVADLMQKFLLAVSAASDIPATRLLGQSAIGLNATGEGEERNYYDRVSADQENKYRPVLNQLDAVMVRSALGAMPEDYEYEFNPLRQMTEIEQADIDLKNSQRDNGYLTAGVITEAIVAQELKDNNVYAAVDDEYIDILKELETADLEENEPEENEPEENEPEENEPEENEPEDLDLDEEEDELFE